MSKQESRFLAIFATGAVLALLVASLWDLPLAKAAIDQNSIFGTLFQTFGMFPPSLIVFISCQIFLVYALKSGFPLILKGLVAVASLGLAFWAVWGWVDGWVYYGTLALNNIQTGAPLGAANNSMGATAAYSFSLEVLVVLLIWAAGTVLTYLWLRKKALTDFKYLAIAAVAGLAFVYLSGSLVSAMKTNWGRFRPYEISQVFASAKGSFTNWWQINGINGHQSFPSGHTLAGMSALFLPFFVSRENVRWQQVLAYSALIYGTLMAAARVRIGAHFLSDVTMSAILVGLLVFILMKVLGYSFIEKERIILD